MQLAIVMFWNPPPDSVPILIALQWLETMQSEMTMFSQGFVERLFMTIASSSESTLQPDIVTSRQESILRPSLLYATWLKTAISRMVRRSQFR